MINAEPYQRIMIIPLNHTHLLPEITTSGAVLVMYLSRATKPKQNEAQQTEPGMSDLNLTRPPIPKHKQIP